ncbi:hypothetical protein ANN_11442 [Periplaneta americana]|uniref:Uncharacterized protein n=1 Tax=Periplaneta americana TaxID=6978 RepID=A0ABQ8T6G1_PERAM|nr:hypothetical protein ANN_11442 [Periplaneta americana]
MRQQGKNNCPDEDWNAVSTTRLFSVDDIGDSGMIFGEMRTRIRHRLLAFTLRLEKTSEKTQPGIGPPEYLSRLRRVPADSELHSGVVSIPAWADHLVEFFPRFSPTAERMPACNASALAVRPDVSNSRPAGRMQSLIHVCGPSLWGNKWLRLTFGIIARIDIFLSKWTSTPPKIDSYFDFVTPSSPRQPYS